MIYNQRTSILVKQLNHATLLPYHTLYYYVVSDDILIRDNLLHTRQRTIIIIIIIIQHSCPILYVSCTWDEGAHTRWVRGGGGAVGN